MILSRSRLTQSRKMSLRSVIHTGQWFGTVHRVDTEYGHQERGFKWHGCWIWLRVTAYLLKNCNIWVTSFLCHLGNYYIQASVLIHFYCVFCVHFLHVPEAYQCEGGKKQMNVRESWYRHFIWMPLQTVIICLRENKMIKNKQKIQYNY